MKNLLISLKRIIVDNKEYFIKCTLMSVLAAFILAIAISFAVPVSAAGEPSEGGGSVDVISSGSYSFKTDLSSDVEFISFSLPFTCLYNSQDLGLNITMYCDGFTFSNIEGDLQFNIVSSIPDLNSYGFTYPFGWYMHGGGGWDPSFSERRIVVTEDTVIDNPVAYNWFTNNTINLNNPETDNFVISEGWYLWNEVMLESFNPHILTFNYRTFQRIDGSGIPYYSYWSSMVFDNYIFDDSYRSRLYYSSISNGRVLVYDSIDGGWVNDTYRRFYISSPITLSAEDYFVFLGYTEYYGDTPPTFSGESVPSAPDPDSNIFTNLIGGVLDALDAFVIFGDFSLLDLVSTLLGGMALIWILKLLAGG